ncbi:hypothetical protein [Streptomyces cavernae]|uniref:hypothetical protein n=1 Tax=Streptomyces cavernae TaxID=2259034 RepID=UPI00192E4A84|nr:hypothetical protein [Streptomyces cavernae]
MNHSGRHTERGAQTEHAQHAEHARPTEHAQPTEHAEHAEHATALPGGLQVSQDGYTIELKTPRIKAGEEAPLRFVITDDRGKAVTDYTTVHDKDLHLILASRDLNTFRHVHPALGPEGNWSIPVELPAAGDYRVLADFTPAGQGAKALTLGADLAVSGSYEPHDLPAQKPTAEVDGYTVTLDGELTPGTMSELRLSVARDGKPVRDLEPYLGAYGHLVALRSGDLAYLHVHPEGEPGDGTTEPGPEISFMAAAPSHGTYRLFLDFKHAGVVRTAAFTVQTSAHAQ